MPAGAVGIVLAGGAGRRLGGAKATVPLDGRPLVAWPLAALRAVFGARVAVVARADTVLPDDLGVPVWIEPDGPRHPRNGIVHALHRAGGAIVLVSAVDLPGLTPATVRALRDAPGDGPAVAVGPDGRVQPLLGRYPPAALAALEAMEQDAPLTPAVLALDPVLVSCPAADLRNVNRPEDLGYPKVKA